MLAKHHFINNNTILLTIILFFAVIAGNWCTGIFWSEPGSPHHIDETFLPYEAVAMWEGIKPRELGWPAATARNFYSLGFALLDINDAKSEIIQGLSEKNPPGLFVTASNISGQIIDNPSKYFIAGRVFSLCFGLSTVLCIIWAGTQWGGRSLGLWCGLLAATSPDLIIHSQVLLADILGILGASVALGFLARFKEEPRSIVFASVACGFATASKHHFGIWLLPLILTAVLSNDKNAESTTFRSKLRILLIIFCSMGITYFFFVPEWWQNPLLMVKEFLHVVGSKMVEGAAMGDWSKSHSMATQLQNISMTLFSDWGTLIIIGCLINICYLRKPARQEVGLICMSAIILLAISKATMTSSRYLHPALPVAILFAASGIDTFTKSKQRWKMPVVALALFITLYQNMLSQTKVGQATRDADAATWIGLNVPAGTSIAIPELFSVNLPKSIKSIELQEAEILSDHHYKRKMESNSMRWEFSSRPFESAIINDDLFRLYWIRKERFIRGRDDGYNVLIHSRSPRSFGILQDKLIENLTNLSTSSYSVDFALLEKPIEPATSNMKLLEVFGRPSELQLYLYQNIKP